MRIKGKILIDQFNGIYRANTLKELKDRYGLRGSISKMYRDDLKRGVTLHVGYVVGDRWLTAFSPVEEIIGVHYEND